MILALATACSTSPRQSGNENAKSANQKPRIGLLLDTLQEERWQKDRDLFTAHATELGAEVTEAVANGDDDLQVRQADDLLAKGVDLLVVVPHDGEAAGAIVRSAKQRSVPVVCYDRLITNADVDLYVSFDSEKVGELQAGYMLQKYPKGNYVLIEGSPTDNNAKLCEAGQRKVLKAAVDRGDVKIVSVQPSRDWSPTEARQHTADALDDADGDVVAVLAANDGTAGGAISALQDARLAGKVAVSGQDAELAAVQRILAGTQTMTVYKPIKPLATRAAEAAVAIARGEKPQTNAVVPNGAKDVPAILLEPITVDKSNLVDTVVKDGFHAREDVYRNVPKEQWPTPR